MSRFARDVHESNGSFWTAQFRKEREVRQHEAVLELEQPRATGRHCTTLGGRRWASRSCTRCTFRTRRPVSTRTWPRNSCTSFCPCCKRRCFPTSWRSEQDHGIDRSPIAPIRGRSRRQDRAQEFAAPLDVSWYVAVKSVLDFVAALMLFILTSPLLLLAMLLVKLTFARPGPVPADAHRPQRQAVPHLQDSHHELPVRKAVRRAVVHRAAAIPASCRSAAGSGARTSTNCRSSGTSFAAT